ncbi:MAG: 4Fe-4S binding protein, partial [Candidatus Aureabacteria bacterium]|nr:4Fe-4S binding protein [Candidatus Auribacterota bacterium]
MKIVNVGRLRALRRLSQAVFLILFVSLVFHARYSPETINLAAEELIARTPLTIFFRFDPLLGFSLMSGTRLVHAAFLLGLITLGLTLLFGRFFCGWVCPFGTLHQMTGSLRRGRGARTWRRYTRWQSCKYYLLIVLLIAGAAGL